MPTVLFGEGNGRLHEYQTAHSSFCCIFRSPGGCPDGDQRRGNNKCHDDHRRRGCIRIGCSAHPIGQQDWRRQRHGDQQPGWNHLRGGMRIRFSPWHAGFIDSRSRPSFNVYWLERRRVLWHRYLQHDHNSGHIGIGRLHVELLHSFRQQDRRWQWHGHQQPGRHHLRGGLRPCLHCRNHRGPYRFPLSRLLFQQLERRWVLWQRYLQHDHDSGHNGIRRLQEGVTPAFPVSHLALMKPEGC
jgi:hypothetical protein